MNKETMQQVLDSQHKKLINSQPWLSDKTKKLIYRSLSIWPDVLEELEERGGINQNYQITLLGGGEASATFWLKEKNKTGFIFKFSEDSLEKEELSLNYWDKRGINVPQVRGFKTIDECNQIDCLVMEAIETGDNLSPRVMDFLQQNPAKSLELGVEMGSIMADVHTLRPKYSEKVKYPNLQEQLLSSFDSLDPYLRKAKIFKEDVSILRSKFQDISNNYEMPSIIHGDFGIRNTLFEENSRRIYVIDPQPTFGDGLYDLAHVLNIRDTSRMFLEQMNLPEVFKDFWQIHEKSYQGIYYGYLKELGDEIDFSKVDVYQAAEALIKAPYRERKILEYAKLFPQFDKRLFEQAVELQRNHLKDSIKKAIN